MGRAQLARRSAVSLQLPAALRVAAPPTAFTARKPRAITGPMKLKTSLWEIQKRLPLRGHPTLLVN